MVPFDVTPPEVKLLVNPEPPPEIIEFVVRDLDIEVIKDSLRINIKDIYKGNGAQRKSGTSSNTKDQE